MGTVAQPLLRGFTDLNDEDIHSYQALIDVFSKEGVLTQKVSAREMILPAGALQK